VTERGNRDLRWWLAALAFFVAFVLLGVSVCCRPPTTIDLDTLALRGHAVGLAAFFTSLGRWYVVVPVILAAATLAFLNRANAWPAGALAVWQILSQACGAAVKTLFGRPRPEHWLLYHETDYSYPSGHAVTAVVFYFGLLLIVARAGWIPRGAKRGLFVALSVCVVWIPWSRLALGAHYLTDVVGGLLFGAAWLCAAIAIESRTRVARH
jgi:membrane-associated phospholipid phosphatase